MQRLRRGRTEETEKDTAEEDRRMAEAVSGADTLKVRTHSLGLHADLHCFAPFACSS